MVATVELPRLTLPEFGPHDLSAHQVLAAFFEFGDAGLDRLRAGQAAAVIGRVRGTGTGVSLTSWIEALERHYPVNLVAPFEQSPNVAGAVWNGAELLDNGDRRGMLKLRFAEGCGDLPLHAHEHSERFIIAIGGRGFFHVSSEPLRTFTGKAVRTVPVRSRDVLMFRRGTIHTFSAPSEPLVLLSYHSPYVPLDDPAQYTIPAVRLTPAEIDGSAGARVSCDPAWTVIA